MKLHQILQYLEEHPDTLNAVWDAVNAERMSNPKFLSQLVAAIDTNSYGKFVASHLSFDVAMLKLAGSNPDLKSLLGLLTQTQGQTPQIG